MPNHVTNVLTFEGEEQEVRRVLEEIQNEKYGLHSIDFNKMIPMPPELDIESGSRSHKGLELYQDFMDSEGIDGTQLAHSEEYQQSVDRQLQEYTSKEKLDPDVMKLGQQC